MTRAPRAPTDPRPLVHEAFLRLARQGPGAWQGRSHFIAVAATAMRQILTDHARRRAAAKRGGPGPRVAIDGDQLPGKAPGEAALLDVLALDEALSRLAQLSPRQARILELQCFGGLTLEEVAGVLEVSLSLVEKEARRARAWLRKELARR